MDLVIPVTQTAGYRPIYTPQPSMYPQQMMHTMVPNPTPQPIYNYPQPSIMPQMVPQYQSPQYQSTHMNNYSLNPIIPNNDNRELHHLSHRLNDGTRDINDYSNKGLSDDNIRIIGNMIDKRVSQAIKESHDINHINDDIEIVNSSKTSEVNDDIEIVNSSKTSEVNEVTESETKEEVIKEKEEVIKENEKVIKDKYEVIKDKESVINDKEETESESENDEIEERPKKKKNRSRKITKKRSKNRNRIRRIKSRKGMLRKMKVKKSLLRNNIIVGKSGDQLNKLQEFFFENKIELDDIPTKIKRKLIPSLEIQKHKYYINSLKELERKLINRFMKDKEFNKQIHNYVRKELNDDPELDKHIKTLNSIIKGSPKLTRNIVVFKDISFDTKLKKNNIYTESSIGVSRFNPLPITKGDTNTLSIKIPKLNKCLILAKNNVFDSGEILMPLSSKFKINNIKNISLDNNKKHILYQSSLQ